MSVYARWRLAAIAGFILAASAGLAEDPADSRSAPPLLGAPAPAVTARTDTGAALAVAELRGQSALLLLIGDPAPPRELRRRLRARGVELLLAAPGSQAATRFAADGRTAVFIDRRGVVRRIVRRIGGSDDPETIVKRWDDGRALYQAQCSRCHGDDGKDTGYPGTKSLAGIGNHMTEERILAATRATGAVDLTAYSRQLLDALAAYVAGL
jgi:cytochrome c553